MMVIAGSRDEYRIFCRNRGLDPLAHAYVQRARDMLPYPRHGAVAYYGSYAKWISNDELAEIRKICISRQHYVVVDRR